MKSILLLILVLICSTIEAQEKITYTSANRVFLNGERLHKNEVKELLKFNRQAYLTFQKAQNTATIGNILLIGGIVATPIIIVMDGVNAIGGIVDGEYDSFLWVAGFTAGLAVMGITLKIIAGSRKKKRMTCTIKKQVTCKLI